jgi:hypothetical protein
MLNVITLTCGPLEGDDWVLEGHISEAEFLLTELEYTISQIQVQIGDLDAKAPDAIRANGRTPAEILKEMLRRERAFQNQYARLLHVSAPATVADEDSAETTLAHERARTIQMLRDAGEWSVPLLDVVRQHAAHDRQWTTALAEGRLARVRSATRSRD